MISAGGTAINSGRGDNHQKFKCDRLMGAILTTTPAWSAECRMRGCKKPAAGHQDYKEHENVRGYPMRMCTFPQAKTLCLFCVCKLNTHQSNIVPFVVAGGRFCMCGKPPKSHNGMSIRREGLRTTYFVGRILRHLNSNSYKQFFKSFLLFGGLVPPQTERCLQRQS